MPLLTSNNEKLRKELSRPRGENKRGNASTRQEGASARPVDGNTTMESLVASGKPPPHSDAFLPSGGLDINSHHLNANLNLNGNSSSILSPLPPSYNSSLAHGFPPSGLVPFDAGAALSPTSLNGRMSGQLQAHSLHPQPHAHQQSHNPFSHLNQSTSYPRHPADLRAHSLSPNKLAGRTSSPQSQFDRPLPHLPPGVNGASTLYRSVSADAAGSPPQAANHLVQRLAQQNALIREAWEAERNYLEANRHRVEEVYQEERIIMEEVRESWENEKAAMTHQMQTLKERIQRLEGENAALKGLVGHGVQLPGVMSPQASQREGSVDASVDGPPSSISAPVPIPPHQASTSADASCLPPGLEGAARRPHFASPGSSKPSPTSQPENSPFIPLDPRMQTQSPNPKDFLAPSKEEQEGPVPVIDVNQLDPKLEGISLKAPAVQKATFDSNLASPTMSPPIATDSQKPNIAATSTTAAPGLVRRTSSKDRTIQALHAEESRRLTMHAGHTPNHSLSLFPTMSVVEGSTAGQSDRQTPVVESADPHKEHGHEDATDEELSKIEKLPPAEVDEGDVEEQFEPVDDVKLKGPLMIKNIPAQDEIFFDRLNKKLEPISQGGRDALPTVMRTSSGENPDAGPSHVVSQGHHVGPIGGDASHDNEDVDSLVSGQKRLEADIPLKIKTTTNFGAPFGVA